VAATLKPLVPRQLMLALLRCEQGTILHPALGRSAPTAVLTMCIASMDALSA
jgi:hypothetical protein